MLPSHRLLLLGVLALPTLSGCGSSSYGTESGTIAQAVSGSVPTGTVTPPKAGPVAGGVTGTDNNASATASIAGTLVVAVGASQTIAVTFTSTDGLPLSGFSVYGSLGAFPSGWSAPGALTCARVGPGSGCVLTLTYAPVAIETGTLTLDCVYIDNAGLPRTPGPCMTLSYAATSSNNVVASVAPAGEIDAAVGGGKQSVSVDFTTDDGNAATALTLTTNLGALPAGWSSAAAGLSCAVVSTGSSCRLPLQFAPTAAGSGTVMLNYTYVDDSGAARSGAINIPYATASNGNVTAGVSPAGQVNAAAMGGQQSVAVSFTTDDDKTASGLRLTSDLTKLPAGWSNGSGTFGCDMVGAGNGCQLQLNFAPTALSAGTLTLRYSYNDASGMPNFGVAIIPYAATTNDNVVGTTSPTGQITAMQGSPAQPISVTFTTDDGRLASGLQITSSLASLPPGFSSTASSFGCSALSGGASACQLILTYAPTGVDNGTLNLSYAYVNNAGESKSGTLAIPYQTTTNDNIIGSASPTSLAAATGSSNFVTVSFATDDGNSASALTADLSALPAGWSTASSALTCPTVSAGSSCQVSLTYAPTAAAAGSLAFGFSYTNSAGMMKTGTVSIPYTAAP
jgi:hypothetical protein